MKRKSSDLRQEKRNKMVLTCVFAVLAVVRWRRQACAPFMALPLIFLASWFAGFLASGDLKAEDLLNMTMAPLCTLAAFGLISASRSWKSMLDGFAVTVTTLAIQNVCQAMCR